jgi:hypothetical protein
MFDKVEKIAYSGRPWAFSHQRIITLGGLAMKKRLALLVALMGLAAWSLSGCSEDENNNGNGAPTPGKIEVEADNILDRENDVLSVAVYADTLDWYPGAPNEAVISRAITTMDSSNFSFSHVMQELDAQQQETGVEMEFEPATYSVVFFVSEQGSAPDRFVEVRAQVNGDMIVEAPPWDQWP